MGDDVPAPAVSMMNETIPQPAFVIYTPRIADYAVACWDDGTWRCGCGIDWRTVITDAIALRLKINTKGRNMPFFHLVAAHGSWWLRLLVTWQLMRPSWTRRSRR